MSRVTGNILICAGWDSNPHSGERQKEDSGNALDHTAIRTANLVYVNGQDISPSIDTINTVMAVCKFNITRCKCTHAIYQVVFIV